MTLVKICGLTRPQDIEAVNALMPDMAGFVFYGPSRRCVTRETARELGSILAPSIVKVGVFVDEDPLVIADLVGSGVIDAVQLHGVEDSAYIHGLRRLVDAPVIKTFLIRDIGDVEAANRSDADCILLDAGMGSGRTFDWSLLDAMKRDYILSGGLNPGNIRDAVEMLHPYGVDVSSGVETDGRKDPSKMSAFLETVHRMTIGM